MASISTDRAISSEENRASVQRTDAPSQTSAEIEKSIHTLEIPESSKIRQLYLSYISRLFAAEESFQKSTEAQSPGLKFMATSYFIVLTVIKHYYENRTLGKNDLLFARKEQFRKTARLLDNYISKRLIIAKPSSKDGRSKVYLPSLHLLLYFELDFFPHLLGQSELPPIAGFVPNDTANLLSDWKRICANLCPEYFSENDILLPIGKM
ncbi:MAG: hypothetical protein VW226_13260 [Rhodospirillaceae bacterium]